MGRLVYKTDVGMVPETFQIGHSMLKIKALDYNFSIEFLATYYMELSRMFIGLEVWELTAEEADELLLRRPDLRSKVESFWKIVSDGQDYYIAASGFRIHE